MATATVPKLVLTVNHASGAGYYAMAGQGFDPDFIFTWPTGRMGVMEGESAVQALFGPALEELKQKKAKPDAALQQKIDAVRADYEQQLDARFAAARGFVDVVLAPEDTRPALSLALRTALSNTGPAHRAVLYRLKLFTAEGAGGAENAFFLLNGHGITAGPQRYQDIGHAEEQSAKSVVLRICQTILVA